MEDLEKAIIQSFERSGIRDKLLAQARSELLLIAFSSGKIDKAVNSKEYVRENAIINAIIREYLVFNNYKCTLSVFDKESSSLRSSAELNSERSVFVPDRETVGQYLNVCLDDMTIDEDDGSTLEIPILYGMVEQIRKVEN